MTFGLAMEELKDGKKVARSGWDGRGMFLYHVPPAPSGTTQRNKYGTIVSVLPESAQDNVVPWQATQPDMLAEDWEIVE